MGLIAFYDCKRGICESLYQHLKCVTEEISKRFLPKRAILLSKLLKPYANFDLDIIKRTILYTSILHDSGKAYDYFQKTLMEKGTAPHHEVFSVYLADKVLIKLRKELKSIILLSIAWHHSSTRGAVLERIAGTTNQFLRCNLVELNEHSRGELIKILESIFLRFNCLEEVDLSKTPTSISVKDTRLLLNNQGITLRMEKSNLYRTYRATLPLLTALQVADAKVSFENRRTSHTLPIHVRDITDLDARRRIVNTIKS